MSLLDELSDELRRKNREKAEAEIRGLKKRLAECRLRKARLAREFAKGRITFHEYRNSCKAYIGWPVPAVLAGIEQEIRDRKRFLTRSEREHQQLMEYRQRLQAITAPATPAAPIPAPTPEPKRPAKPAVVITPAQARILIAALLIVCFAGLGIFFGPQLTGLFTFQQENTYTISLGINITGSEELAFEPERDGTLKRLALSGAVVGNGSVIVTLVSENESFVIYERQGFEQGGGEAEGGEAEEGEDRNASSLPSSPVIALLSYGSSTIPNSDEDNDGIEGVSGVIDFEIDALFNLFDVFNLSVSENTTQPETAPDDSQLCTEWEVHSIEAGSVARQCYGSAACCEQVGLLPIEDTEWNDSYFVNYGRLGAGYDNTVSARVILILLTEDREGRTMVESEQQSLPAVFDEVVEEGAVLLEEVCGETCLLHLPIAGLAGPSGLLIRIEAEQAVLVLESITYVLLEQAEDLQPLVFQPDNISMRNNETYELNLAAVFEDPEGRALEYSTTEPRNIEAILEDSLLTLSPEENFTGTRFIILSASDGRNFVSTDLIRIDVREENVTNVTEVIAIAGLNATQGIILPKRDFGAGEEITLEFDYRTGEELADNSNNETSNETPETPETAETAERSRGQKQTGSWRKGRESVRIALLDNSRRSIHAIASKAEIEELRDGRLGISIPAPAGRAFRPGRYTIQIELDISGNYTLFEQDFTWGVLAINTHKSIYLPEEEAFIGMAVLDDGGHVVCDADVTLHIISPNNLTTTQSTADSSIAISDECEFLGVTRLPDYYTHYTVGRPGAYSMNLTAVTDNGVRTITDEFLVQESVEFDVARHGPTRVYPFVPYVMNISIRANEDFDGEVTEYVPASFAIREQQGLRVTRRGNEKILAWGVDFSEGRIYSLSYEFDAPDVSPQFYLLGKAGIGDWDEYRYWQVASDAPALISVRISPAATAYPYENLFGYCNATEESEESLMYNYTWYKNGVVNVSELFKADSLKTGLYHTCGIRANDSVLFCWGLNSYGQIGDGTTDTPKTNPTLSNTTPPLTSIAAGYYHTCGIRANDSRAMCWGHNAYGQIGDGTSGATNHRYNATLTTDTAAYTSIAAGSYHTCGIRASDSRAMCWGNGGNGRLGNGIIAQQNNPTLTNDTAAYTSIAAGLSHTCGIRANDSRAMCWGNNGNGRLGDGTTTDRLNPTLTNDTAAYTSIAAGGFHTCGIRANDSRVMCWGWNAYAQIGDGTTTLRLNPTLTNDTAAYTSIAAGAYHTCGIRANDSVLFCWGRNNNGQIGDGTTTTNRPNPTLTNDTSSYYPGFPSGKEILVSVVGNSETSIGDNWRFACLATNGTVDSSWSNSTATTILNPLCVAPESGSWNVSHECASISATSIEVNGDLNFSDGVSIVLSNVNITVEGNTYYGAGSSVNHTNGGRTIWYNGNVTIDGSVLWNRETVHFNGTDDTDGNGSVMLIVSPTGTLIVENSTNITNGEDPDYRYAIVAENNSVFSVRDSYIFKAGYSAFLYEEGIILFTNTEFINNTVNQSWQGLTLYNASGSLIANNSFTTDSIGLEIGVDLVNNQNTTHLTIDNNNIHALGGAGIYFFGRGAHSTVTDSIILSDGGSAVLLSTGDTIHNITLFNNSMETTSTSQGFAVSSGGSDLLGIRVEGSTINSTSGSAVYLQDDETTIANTTITSQTGYGIEFATNGKSRNIMDSIIHAPGSNDVRLQLSGNSVFNTFTNVSFSKYDISRLISGNMTVMHRADFLVNDSEGSLVNGATVRIYNNGSELLHSLTTDTTGTTGIINLTEFYYDGTSWEMTNYTIEAVAARHVPGNLSFNITDSNYTGTSAFAIMLQLNEPNASNVRLNSSLGTNLTSENLTVWFTQTHPEGAAVTNITDWRLNGSSIAVLNMPFNTNRTGETGSSVRDYSTNANNGTLQNGIAWNASGIVGGAYFFDSSNDHISIADSNSLDVTDNLTIAAWVNQTDVTDNQTIVGKWLSAGDQRSYMLSSDNSYLSFYASNNGKWSSYTANRVQSSTKLNANQLYHFAATFEAGTVTFYIDGNLDKVLQFSSMPSIHAGTSPLRIGSNNNEIAAEYFTGWIDEVLIFNRSLGAEQINALYQAGKQTNSLQTIEKNTTIRYQNWTAAVTPNDASADGKTRISNSIFILNTLPQVWNVSPDMAGSIADETYNITWRAGDDDIETFNFSIWYSDTPGLEEKPANASIPEEEAGCSISGGDTYCSYIWNTSDISSGYYYLTVNLTDAEVSTGNFSLAMLRINHRPNGSSVVLNSTDGTNFTLENLTVYFSQSDPDADATTNITDWRLNGTSIALFNLAFNTNRTGQGGSVVRDYSTHSNNGTLNGNMLWNQTSKVGGGYWFDGDGDYIDLGTDSSLDMGTNNFTFTVWVKNEGDGYPSTGIILSNRPDDVTPQWQGYILGFANNKTFFYTIEPTSQVTSVRGVAERTFDGEWHHIAYVRNGTTLSIYVDGGLDNTTDGTVRDIANNQNTYLGYETSGDWWHFNGSMDEPMLFNRSVGPEQINESYRAGLNGHSIQRIVMNETLKWQNWTVAVTPNDGLWDGDTLISNNVLIRNSPPRLLNASDNVSELVNVGSTVNFTIFAKDSDNDPLRAVIDNGTNFASCDYSTVTGCIAQSSAYKGSVFTANLTATGTVEWTAQICDEEDSCDYNTNKTYAFAETGDKEAAEMGGLLPAHPLHYNRTTTAENKSYIASDDDDYWNTTIAETEGEHDSQLYLLNISEINTSINNITVAWKGYGETAANYFTNVSIFNWSSGEWYEVVNNDFTAGNDAQLDGNISLSTVLIPDMVNNTAWSIAVMATTEKYVASPFLYVYDGSKNKYDMLSDFLPYATSKQEEYTSFTALPDVGYDFISDSSASRTSAVVNDLTSPIEENSFSYDQTGHFNFNANAMYGASFLCESSSLSVSGMNDKNSDDGISFIFFSINDNNSSQILDGSADLEIISVRCRLISSNSNSGAYSSSAGESTKSIKLPATSAENTMFESTTNRIYFEPASIFLYLLYNESLTFRPSRSASDWVSLDFETSPLNTLYSTTVSEIARRATSDQFISGSESISDFRSSGIASVSVGICHPPFACNANNPVYYVQLYKTYENVENNSLVGIVVVPEGHEYYVVPFDFEGKNKTANMNSLVVTQPGTQVLEMQDISIASSGNLVNLLSDCDGQYFVFFGELGKFFAKCWLDDNSKAHFSPISLSSSAGVMGFNLPALSNLTARSPLFTASLTTDPLTTRLSSSDISDISMIFLFSSTSLTSDKVSANARLATDDQFTQSVLSISALSASGTESVIVPILSDLQSLYVYPVQTKEIFKPFGQDKSNEIKLRITEELDETAYIDSAGLAVFEYPEDREEEFNAWFADTFEQVNSHNWRPKDGEFSWNTIPPAGITNADLAVILEDDGNYLVMEKGAQHELVFEVPPYKDKYRRRLFFVANGYYIEHQPEAAEDKNTETRSRRSLYTNSFSLTVEANASGRFYVDIDIPVINWSIPEDANTSAFGVNFTQNITFIDTNLHMYNCSIYNDSAFTYPFYSIEESLTGNEYYQHNDTINISTWEDGTYYEHCEVSDS